LPMNMKSRLVIILSMIICLFGGLNVYAQDGTYSGYSPYSIFGIGDINSEGSSYNKSLGNVGIATRNNRYVNTLNPAAVTARDSLSFMADVSLSLNNKYFKQGSLSSANNTFNISNFVLSFPIYGNKLAAYVGIDPYSSVGYNITTVETDKSYIAANGYTTNVSDGNGSVYRLFLGTGVRLWEDLSVGVEGMYYFGNLTKGTVCSSEDTSVKTINRGYDLTLKGWSAKFGAQYTADFGNEKELTIGATYKLSAPIRGYVEDYNISSISSVSDTTWYRVDTLKHNLGKVKFASELGVGINFKASDKWMVEFNYLYSQSSKTGMESVAGFANNSQTVSFGTTNSQSFRLGASYIPNRNDIRYYARRIEYRAGAFYDKMYYTVNGLDVNAFGLTFGAGFPINKQRNYLNFAVELGQKGSTNSNLIRERFINFTFGVNIFDIWFVKHRYN